MGTRNLTMVVLNNETKIAQYGQWDGYPEGQGKTVLNFLLNTNLQAFKEKLRDVRFFTEEESNAIPEKDWEKDYPQLSRDHGAGILQMVMDGVTRLSDASGFAADSLFCEWAYVIDFDKGIFEIYEGFNKTPLTEGDRFFGLTRKDEEYHPVKLAKSYSLIELPSAEKFIEDLKSVEEEEE